MSEKPGRWGDIDEAMLKARRRRHTIRQIVTGLSILGIICCFISTLLGVTQGILGQWWIKPPRYPNAVETRYEEGQVCRMYALGVYCYEWFYETEDSVETVIDYYENLDWRFHDPMVFEWRRGRRFNLAWVTEDCVTVLGDRFCYQIIVRPAPGEENLTQIYILERSQVGDIQSVR